MVIGIGKKVFFSVEVTFSTTKEGPTFVYDPLGTRLDHRYSTIRARSGIVSVSCWGGFLIVEGRNPSHSREIHSAEISIVSGMLYCSL